MLKKNSKIHFVGIGGIGMSGLAQLLLRKGYKVSGSDLKETDITQRLEGLGAEIFYEHSARNINDCNLLVTSSAVKSNNPEVKKAKKQNIKIIKRSKLLADLMKDKTTCVVAGAHGKTTTSSMLAFLLQEAGFCPTACIGGVVKNFGTNCVLGESEYFVAELDESDGSFLQYHPNYAILTNIDFEHVDYFKNWHKIIAAYKQFINNIKKGGKLIACADDENVKDILAAYKKDCLFYGFSPSADITAKNISYIGMCSEFDCYFKRKKLGKVLLNIPGRHNVSNALAVIALGLDLRIEFKKISKILAKYMGTERRFHVRFKSNDLTVVDDYAHHPSEISATLEAARRLHPKRLFVVFQPHRYTRTKALFNEFCTSLQQIDKLVITDIYAASEKPILGVDSRNIYSKIKSSGEKNVSYCPKNNVLEGVIKAAKKGDLLLFLGAGDIYKISEQFSRKLKKEEIKL